MRSSALLEGSAVIFVPNEGIELQTLRALLIRIPAFASPPLGLRLQYAGGELTD